MLRLNGHFSYIDQYNHLKFVFINNETKQKLHQCCRGLTHPFDDEGFTCALSKKTFVPQDIRAKVGLDCVVHVKPTTYNFISKLERNYGERVSGTKLVLVDIQVSSF